MGLLPFSELAHAFLEFAPRLEFRVRDGRDGDFGQRVADERAQVLGESPEGVIAALDAFLSASGCSCSGSVHNVTDFESMDET